MGMVTVLGTVASLVSLEVRVTINSLLVLVLRVMVADAVPVSEITSLSIVICKEGLSLSSTLIVAMALPVSRVTLLLV